MKKLILALAMPMLFVGCTKDTNKPKTGLYDKTQITGQLEAQYITIKTIDDEPIRGAQILIGDAQDRPFVGNFLTTNEEGQIALPTEWASALAVTINAPGYVRATYFEQEPGSLTYKLRRQPSPVRHEVKGTPQGLPVVDKDGFIDFALVMPAFTRYDMLAFDINMVISPQKDEISVAGQDVKIPANISLPKQAEKYTLFTINLDKPTYRIYYPQSGINRVFAARGRFPFKSTVDALRGGAEFYELINDFQINGGSVRDIEIKSNPTNLDIPTKDLTFNGSKGMTAPRFEEDELFIAVGVAQQSGYLIPTDVKKPAPNEKISLRVLPQTHHLILGVIKKSADMKTNGDRMSTVLLPFTAGISPTALPLIDDPQVVGTEVILPRVQSISGVTPLATYSILSREEEVLQGKEKVKLFSPHWEIYSANWAEKFRLPDWPNEPNLKGKKRWEVNFVGSQTTSQAPLGSDIIESATHVTHSSITFQ